MPGVKNRRKKIKAAHIKLQEAKQAAAIAKEPEYGNLNTPESADAVVETKSKPGRKKIQKEERNFTMTRQMASVLEAKETEKEEIRTRTEQSREQIVQNRKNSKKRRREINEKVNQNIKIRKLEERTKELEEALAAKPSTTYMDPLSIVTEEDEVLALKSQPTFDVHDSTRIKNTLGLTQNKYGEFRNELAKKGINMPSPSTVKRNEKKIFKEYYPNTEKPDFYGMVEKTAMKHDFSKLENVRITIGGDGGGNGKKSSVKIGFFFNDVETPLSVDKFYLIWSYVGKESWQRLKPILEYIDADILRLQQDGVMTNSGLKLVIITYIGDCKFQCECLSIQGGNAGCGCPKCVAKRSVWPTIKAADIILRTIQSILENAEQVSNHNGQPKMYSSVFQFPLLRNIPISHFVPPPVHILISLLTEIIAWIRKIKGQKYAPLDEFLKQTKAKLHWPAQTYNGNECRKILNNFRPENPKRILYNGYGSELLEAASNIVGLAVARTLTDEEIKSLESFIKLFFNLVKECCGSDGIKFFLNKTKIHMLKEHVIPFVQTFRSWGLFSEQSVESIHHIRNKLDDLIPGEGPEIDVKRNNFFLKNQAVLFHYS